ncbi:MAG TPA: ATP-grasp domain-containing protein [Gemmatimonadaceae bacterium]|nr:ATP-grasp domain-containing protein [Gemmatimonadaceae bacterium]
MKIIILHSEDALGPPADPVLEQIANALKRADHETAFQVVLSDVVALATALRSAEPDLIVNLAEAFDGKSALESNVAALLNLLDMRYTGSSPAGLMLAGDKALCKKVLSFHGVLSPQFATVHRGDVEWAGDLSFPLIVKPPQEDASIGITHASVVHNVQELLEQMGEVQGRFQQPPLVEQFIDGREFYVGVIGNADARALPPLEMDFTGFPADRPKIASWAAKWGEKGEEDGAEYAGTRSILPKDLPPELDECLRKTALDAFHALRLRDYARVDMRATEAGEVYVIEVNPNCYLEESGEFARAAAADGMDYDALIGRLIELASARYAR